MNLDSKIYLAGNTGMVGSAILKNLQSKGYRNFVFSPYPKYDLINQATVDQFFSLERPDIVIDAAAKVGGIVANNTFRAQFIYENLMIQNNLIQAAHKYEVEKFLFLGSSCIYPRNCPQPMREELLLSDKLEPTNEPYAIAKIAGIKMCENYYHQYGNNFISVMPTNLYGSDDNFDLTTSHVIPALIRKFHESKIYNQDQVEVWGSGNPKREFMFVDDMAAASVYILENLTAEQLDKWGVSHINIGTGTDITIKELATLIGEVVGFNGKIIFNSGWFARES